MNYNFKNSKLSSAEDKIKENNIELKQKAKLEQQVPELVSI